MKKKLFQIFTFKHTMCPWFVFLGFLPVNVYIFRPSIQTAKALLQTTLPTHVYSRSLVTHFKRAAQPLTLPFAFSAVSAL